MSTAGAIVIAARQYLGVRWQHQGRDREGLDCAGLVIAVAHDLGLSDFDTRDYERQATDETMLQLCRQHLQEVPTDGLQPGDVVVMRFENQRHIAFVGDYVHGGLSLIHAHAPSRRVVEHRLDSVWRERIAGAFRFDAATPEGAA